MLIMTLLGEMDDSLLDKEVQRTKVDCGHAVVTRYFFKGELVRQDTLIEVDKVPAIGSKGGLFSKGTTT